MAEADLFIGAGGGTSWERAALGLPTLCISVAGNQEANARLLAEAGMHVYLGASEQVSIEQIRQAVAALVGDYPLRQSLAQRSRQLVDGQGASRVAAALFEMTGNPLRCAGDGPATGEFTRESKENPND